jgi:flavin-dependent dehydrogenase
MTRKRVSDCREVCSTRICRAESGRAERFSAQAFLAIGDAAFSTDPARGHGILNAFRQAIAAADAIAEYLLGHPQKLILLDRGFEAEFNTYFSGIEVHYGAEKRWPMSDFWNRRHKLGRQVST